MIISFINQKTLQQNRKYKKRKCKYARCLKKRQIIPKSVKSVTVFHSFKNSLFQFEETLALIATNQMYKTKRKIN